MKILITGGLGYVGRILTTFFIEKGHEVTVLDREIPDNNVMDKEEINVLEGDILSFEDMSRACTGIDWVIHLAGMPAAQCELDPESAKKVNSMGTGNVIEAAVSRCVKRFLYLSTFHVYGRAEGRITEETKPHPKHEYGKSKLSGEKFCLQGSGTMIKTILRLSNMYGYSPSPKGDNLVVNDFCRQALKNGKIVLHSSGVQKRQFIAGSDLAQAMYLILHADVNDVKGKVFNVGGNDSISILEVARKVIDVFESLYGVTVELEVPDSNDTPANDLDFSIDRLKSIGFSPQASMDEEIKKILRNSECELNDR